MRKNVWRLDLLSMQMRLMEARNTNTFLHRAFVNYRFNLCLKRKLTTKIIQANKGHNKQDYARKCVREAHEHKHPPR